VGERAGAGHLGPRVRDRREHARFLCREPLHRLDQTRDEIAAALKLVVDLRPRLVDRLPRVDQLVVSIGDAAAQAEHEQQDHANRNQHASLHLSSSFRFARGPGRERIAHRVYEPLPARPASTATAAAPAESAESARAATASESAPPPPAPEPTPTPPPRAFALPSPPP